MLFFWIYEYKHTDDDWSGLLKHIFFTRYYFRWKCRFDSCFKIFAIIKACFKSRRGCFHTPAIEIESTPVCPLTQARYGMAFPSDVLLPPMTSFARIFCSRVLAVHSLSFPVCHFPHNLWTWAAVEAALPWCCDVSCPCVLRVSRWKSRPCPSHQKVWVTISFSSEQLAK